MRPVLPRNIPHAGCRAQSHNIPGMQRRHTVSAGSIPHLVRIISYFRIFNSSRCHASTSSIFTSQLPLYRQGDRCGNCICTAGHQTRVAIQCSRHSLPWNLLNLRRKELLLDVNSILPMVLLPLRNTRAASYAACHDTSRWWNPKEFDVMLHHSKFFAVGLSFPSFRWA